MPVAVKDVLCTAGQTTTCSSRMLAHFVPPYDATVVTQLREAGVVLLGKTNMDEFAMGGSTENAALGQTRNPWDRGARPGRFERRFGGRRRGANGAAGDRQRHGRLDPPTGGFLRHGGAQTDLRTRQPLRSGGVCQ